MSTWTCHFRLEMKVLLQAQTEIPTGSTKRIGGLAYETDRFLLPASLAGALAAAFITLLAILLHHSLSRIDAVGAFDTGAGADSLAMDCA